MGWGAPGLGDDWGWDGEAICDAQGCEGGPSASPLGLLERDVILRIKVTQVNPMTILECETDLFQQKHNCDNKNNSKDQVRPAISC